MARPRKFQEDEVVTAARDRFWATGYDGTSMSDLVEATGVASQSLYGAFGSKHDIFLRALQQYCAAQVAMIADVAGSSAGPWATVLATATWDGDRVRLRPDGCFLASSAAALARRDDDVRTAADRTYSEIRASFVTLVRRARDLGEIRADADPDEVAATLLVVMQGIEFVGKSGAPADVLATARRSAVATLNAAYATPVRR
jgi:TetR/AcrR family transcriptional regulator, transcriptional repressor for nem operon